MSQFNAPVRRSGGGLNVYTALLVIAFLVMTAGVALLATRNMEHSAEGNQPGGLFTLIQK